MAKKPMRKAPKGAAKKAPPKRGDMSWMNRFATPTQREFRQFQQAQRGQFTPTINTLLNQMRSTQVETDPTVRAYEQMMAGLPTGESVSKAYQSGLQNLATYMQGLDTARAGKGVSDVVGALGAALGVEGAGELAQAAGTVSGVGETGGDVMSKALMQAAAGQFAGLETERLGQLADQRQELMLGAGQARSAVKQQRQELGRMLAEARGQRIGAMVNPFERAAMIRSFQDAASGISGGNYGMSQTPPTPNLPQSEDLGIGIVAQDIEGISKAGYPTGYPTGSIPRRPKPRPKRKIKQR